jgi:hypothetical protein
LSSRGLIALKQGGVSDNVIMAMMNRASSGPTAAAAPAPPGHAPATPGRPPAVPPAAATGGSRRRRRSIDTRTANGFRTHGTIRFSKMSEWSRARCGATWTVTVIRTLF